MGHYYSVVPKGRALPQNISKLEIQCTLANHEHKCTSTIPEYIRNVFCDCYTDAPGGASTPLGFGNVGLNICYDDIRQKGGATKIIPAYKHNGQYEQKIPGYCLAVKDDVVYNGTMKVPKTTKQTCEDTGHMYQVGPTFT